MTNKNFRQESVPKALSACWFNEDVICVKVDGHHDVPVATLWGEWECTRLVSVDGVGEVFDAEECLVGFGDWDVMEMWVLSFNLYPYLFDFDNFL